MGVDRLHPSHSAPDLSELLEARTPHAERDAFHDAIGDEDDEDDGVRQAFADAERWRLPTPADSRSATPEVETDNDEAVSQRHHLDRLRVRSESPEIFRRVSQDVDECPGSAPVASPAQNGFAAPIDHDFAYAGRNASSQKNTTVRALRHLPVSLWDYLREELRASELDGSQELKTERISNFFSVPKAVEQIIVFGYFVCLDSFLYTFTILPLRCAFATGRRLFSYLKQGQRRSLPVSAKCDLAKFGVIACASAVLHHVTDASQMYHSVRGQEVIKLYVIFNVLEIADRLCCSLGQDLLDSLCSRATLGRREDGSQPRFRPAALFAMCVAYTVAHTLVLFYSLVSLNVAINSYDNALLTLLLSNQFVEIKSAVFKKFEKENLFQMSCADIVERFQLSLMLGIIAVRNLIELSGSSVSLLPTSFVPFLPSMSALQSILSPALIVIASEMLVDWLKHAFITKFNHIRPAVYGRFIDVLCRDLVINGASNDTSAFADQSPALARRLGLAALPLACLVIRVIFQTFDMLSDTSYIDECAPRTARGGRGYFHSLSIGYEYRAWLMRWLLRLTLIGAVWVSLVVVKLLIGINLRAFAASRYAHAHERASEDKLNDRTRAPIGTNATEKAQDAEVRRLLAKDEYSIGGKPNSNVVNATNNAVSMETLSRFSMVKSRIY